MSLIISVELLRGDVAGHLRSIVVSLRPSSIIEDWESFAPMFRDGSTPIKHSHKCQWSPHVLFVETLNEPRRNSNAANARYKLLGGILDRTLHQCLLLELLIMDALFNQNRYEDAEHVIT